MFFSVLVYMTFKDVLFYLTFMLKNPNKLPQVKKKLHRTIFSRIWGSKTSLYSLLVATTSFLIPKKYIFQ